MKNFWENHVVYHEDGKAKLRGRYWLALAGIINLAGTYYASHWDKVDSLVGKVWH